MGILGDISQALQNAGRWFNRHYYRRLEVWQQVAAGRGGRFQPAERSFFDPKPSRIDVEVDDVAVHVDTFTVQSNNSSQTYTRWRATYLLPTGPTFKIYRDQAGIVSALSSVFGYDDVVLGVQPQFDQHYIVRTGDAAATRAAWSPDAQARMLQYFPHAKVEADGRTVKLTNSGASSSKPSLETGIDLVAGLASYGASWLDGLRALPKATWVPPRGPWDARNKPSVQLELSGVTVWVFPVLDNRTLTFSAAGKAQRELPAFELSVDERGSVDPEPPSEVLPSGAAGLLGQAGPLQLTHDTRLVRAILRGDLDEARTTAAARLVALVAAGSTSLGAFR